MTAVCGTRHGHVAPKEPERWRVGDQEAADARS